MDQRQQQELLEYARFHRLSRDYRNIAQDDVFTVLPRIVDSSLDHDDPLETLKVYLTQNFTDAEKLSLDADGKSLLLWIYSCQRPPDEDYLQKLDPPRRRQNKLDIPLLRTDHELDVRQFASTKYKRLDASGISAFGLAEEEDEGLGWPSTTSELPQKYDTLANSERLDVSREALLLLKSALMNDDTFDAEELYATELVSHRVKNSELKLMAYAYCTSRIPHLLLLLRLYSRQHRTQFEHRRCRLSAPSPLFRSIRVQR